MICRVDNSNLTKYDEFVYNHKNGHLFQSSAYAKANPPYKWEAVMSINDKGEIQGIMSLMILKFPDWSATIIYSPRGPIFDPHNKEVLKELLQGVFEIANQYNALALKCDPCIEEEDEIFLDIMEELGFSVSKGKV
jgi:lipid II:glycine glycyltransferase (peptidoglycan interpeptide bridge formation enzyme)